MREALSWSAQAGVKVLNLTSVLNLLHYQTAASGSTAHYVMPSPPIWSSYQELLSAARASGVDICTENVTISLLPRQLTSYVAWTGPISPGTSAMMPPGFWA